MTEHEYQTWKHRLAEKFAMEDSEEWLLDGILHIGNVDCQVQCIPALEDDESTEIVATLTGGVTIAQTTDAWQRDCLRDLPALGAWGVDQETGALKKYCRAPRNYETDDLIDWLTTSISMFSQKLSELMPRDPVQIRAALLDEQLTQLRSPEYSPDRLVKPLAAGVPAFLTSAWVLELASLLCCTQLAHLSADLVLLRTQEIVICLSLSKPPFSGALEIVVSSPKVNPDECWCRRILDLNSNGNRDCFTTWHLSHHDDVPLMLRTLKISGWLTPARAAEHLRTMIDQYASESP